MVRRRHSFSSGKTKMNSNLSSIDERHVIKVRLQMQLVGQRGQLTGMGKLFAEITRTEGAGALYLGLAPALTRSILYGGLRLGLYEPCKYVCEVTVGSTNFLVKVASGAFSGAIATALTNPTEIMKQHQVTSKEAVKHEVGKKQEDASMYESEP
ncbi:Mitochondrial uncoupling protein 1 [Acorus gramineus]|uniref:Mitochondrial uncoupling protein 1 n=1 Tax=Acorus gramineus TaxID=55184 RepID=A0AAV9AP82_ACOGR|nr:Mitochondrial uncoupling protein 1 [Acorus gramineus]